MENRERVVEGETMNGRAYNERDTTTASIAAGSNHKSAGD